MQIIRAIFPISIAQKRQKPRRRLKCCHVARRCIVANIPQKTLDCLHACPFAALLIYRAASLSVKNSQFTASSMLANFRSFFASSSDSKKPPTACQKCHFPKINGFMLAPLACDSKRRGETTKPRFFALVHIAGSFAPFSCLDKSAKAPQFAPPWALCIA